ncbi:MAG: VCBS repeat-containing protein [Bacteroidota bacterium]
MKTKSLKNRCAGLTLLAVSIAFMALSCLSCSTEDITPLPPDNSGGNEKVFMFFQDFENSNFATQNISTQLGSAISGADQSISWNKLTGVQVGNRQYLFGHYSPTRYTQDEKDYFIRLIKSSGEIGEETEYGEWANTYESLVGFHVGGKGFIFGQSEGDNRWFVQEVTSQGRLAGNESDHGTWSNFYFAITPLYVGDKTFLFFQTKSSDHYYFIAYVSPDGQLYDTCDGYWENYWDRVTSVTVQGNTYLIGHRDGGPGSGKEWFIQKVTNDGTMGDETDRGTWNYYYKELFGYTSMGRAYIFGYSSSGGGFQFIQEITSDGKMGTETSQGTMSEENDSFIPFRAFDPGAVRYAIGWDLSPVNAAPAREWSSIFKDPWSGETEFGGGAALANIDKDAGQHYDAVLMGIQDLVGHDRFYYKVAWNLDGTGKASGWSEIIYGPACGEVQAGGGADIGDIDGNGVPDLLLMNVDNPEGANSFRYHIGWNLGTDGTAASWSPMLQGPALGWDNSGGGAALGDIDKNGRPDLVFMGIDNPSGNNKYWYIVGRNLDKTGKAASWSPMIPAPVDLYYNSAGGGAAMADINDNGKPDLVLMNLDSRIGGNEFWCLVGWDIDINGTAVSWTSFLGPTPGNMTKGGGASVADIDKNGILDLLLMAVDDPYGTD